MNQTSAETMLLIQVLNACLSSDTCSECAIFANCPRSTSFFIILPDRFEGLAKYNKIVKNCGLSGTCGNCILLRSDFECSFARIWECYTKLIRRKG